MKQMLKISNIISSKTLLSFKNNKMNTTAHLTECVEARLVAGYKASRCRIIALSHYLITVGRVAAYSGGICADGRLTRAYSTRQAGLTVVGVRPACQLSACRRIPARGYLGIDQLTANKYQ